MRTRNNQQLKTEYLQWLEPQLRDEHAPQSKSFWELLDIMFEKPFDFSIAMDNNRVVDGLYLRLEYFALNGRTRKLDRMSLGPCSFLEVLIGLSRRMAFIAGGEAPGWAWQLLNHLELQRMSDPLSRRRREKVQEIMDTVIERSYSPDGQGGFFPLSWPDDDQTQIELWYQMNSYIEELHPGH